VALTRFSPNTVMPMLEVLIHSRPTIQYGWSIAARISPPHGFSLDCGLVGNCAQVFERLEDRLSDDSCPTQC